MIKDLGVAMAPKKVKVKKMESIFLRSKVVKIMVVAKCPQNWMRS